MTGHKLDINNRTNIKLYERLAQILVREIFSFVYQKLLVWPISVTCSGEAVYISKCTSRDIRMVMDFV